MSKNKKGYLILIVLVLCALGIYYVYTQRSNDNEENIVSDGITMIKILNGNNGKEIEVNKKDDINKIIDNLKSIDFQKDKSSKDFEGYSFAINLYDIKDNKKYSIGINSEDTIIYDNYFYKSKNSSIDYDIIHSLFGKYDNL